MNAWPTTEEVRATFTASDRLAFNRWLDDHEAKVRAEALQEAADRIEPAPVKPENPYSYDPWEDESVDPDNMSEVVRAAASRGWESGSYAATVSAHMILTSMVAVTRGEAS